MLQLTDVILVLDVFCLSVLKKISFSDVCRKNVFGLSHEGFQEELKNRLKTEPGSGRVSYDVPDQFYL